MIGDDERLVLIDFGLAIDSVDRTFDHTMLAGTLGYQSMEQIAGRPTIQCDCYSVGVLAVELLTGQAPQTMLNGMTFEWQRKCMHLPLHLQEWLDKMLHVDPGQRFSNARSARSLLFKNSQEMRIQRMNMLGFE